MSSSSDHESELPSEDEILYSYRLELPEVNTLLSRISKKRKITSIPRPSVKTPASNDDYSFIYNNKTYQLK
ncbi:11190_t:CDS:2, partial [Cetraspora pellucida]